MNRHAITNTFCGMLLTPLVLAGTGNPASSPHHSPHPATAPERLAQADMAADTEQQEYLESLSREAARSDPTPSQPAAKMSDSAPATPTSGPATGAGRFNAIRSIVSEALAKPEPERMDDPPEKPPAPATTQRREELKSVVISAPPPRDAPGDNYISVLKEEVSTTVVVKPGDEASAMGLKASTARTQTATYAYTVRFGDSLWTIAERVYGNGYRWAAIYEANRQDIPDANVLQVGQQLRLPRE